MAKGRKTGGRVAASDEAFAIRLRKYFYEHIESGPDHLNGCWLWTGDIRQNTGYGDIHRWRDGRMRHKPAHRYSYEMFRPIPEGLQIDHLCRVRHCVNPRHLEAVSSAENIRRAHRPLPGFCKRGHSIAVFGEYVDPGDGGARCRACRADARLRYRRKRWLDA